MEINIKLSNEDIDKLLNKYGYRRSKIAIFYNKYGDDEDLYLFGEGGVRHYFVDVAWLGEKPDCLCEKYPTMETVKDYLLENVVNSCFMDSLMKVLTAN